MTRRLVIALGGNALIRPGEIGTVAEQHSRARELATLLATTLDPGWELVLTHGNGPQVGRVLLRSDLCLPDIPEIPVDVAVAATQGEMGLMMQQAMTGETGRPTVTVLTQVVVDPADPDFQDPTKYIGRFYSQADAERRALELGWRVREDAGRGWRRVVPSPKPIEVLETGAIEMLLAAGLTVVAAGGGGVPVIRTHGTLAGVEAVVDKDRASALLAAELHADALWILTGVDEVQVDFGTPDARSLREVRADELQGYLDAGQFPAGSMGPKVEAVLDFVRRGGREAVITSLEALPEAMRGERGTWISA
jgi:carbamate kinase